MSVEKDQSPETILNTRGLADQLIESSSPADVAEISGDPQPLSKKKFFESFLSKKEIQSLEKEELREWNVYELSDDTYEIYKKNFLINQLIMKLNKDINPVDLKSAISDYLFDIESVIKWYKDITSDLRRYHPHGDGVLSSDPLKNIETKIKEQIIETKRLVWLFNNKIPEEDGWYNENDFSGENYIPFTIRDRQMANNIEWSYTFNQSQLYQLEKVIKKWEEWSINDKISYLSWLFDRAEIIDKINNNKSFNIKEEELIDQYSKRLDVLREKFKHLK